MHPPHWKEDFVEKKYAPLLWGDPKHPTLLEELRADIASLLSTHQAEKEIAEQLSYIQNAAKAHLSTSRRLEYTSRELNKYVLPSAPEDPRRWQVDEQIAKVYTPFPSLNG